MSEVQQCTFAVSCQAPARGQAWDKEQTGQEQKLSVQCYSLFPLNSLSKINNSKGLTFEAKSVEKVRLGIWGLKSSGIHPKLIVLHLNITTEVQFHSIDKVCFKTL